MVLRSPGGLDARVPDAPSTRKPTLFLRHDSGGSVRAKIVDAILVGCAITIVCLVVLQKVAPGTSISGASIPKDTVTDWRRFQVLDRRSGAEAASVSLVLFTDYDCPYCQALSRVIDSAMRELPQELALTVRHFPLTVLHPRARRASAFAECARLEGRLSTAEALLYSLASDSGAEDWVGFAQKVGLANPQGVEVCMRSGPIQALIDADSVVARSLGARGTPVLLVNQRRLSGYMSLEVLRQVIREVR